MVGAFAPQQRKDNSYYHTLVDFERDGHYFDIYKCMCEYCFMQVSVEFLIRYLIHILKSLQISDEERVKSKCESSAIRKHKNRRLITVQKFSYNLYLRPSSSNNGYYLRHRGVF